VSPTIQRCRARPCSPTNRRYAIFAILFAAISFGMKISSGDRMISDQTTANAASGL
jgi:hypothetical protein